MVGQKGRRLTLQQGDLVHFRLNLKDGQPTVESVAISAIWREQAGHVHSWFEKSVSPEVLPYNSRRKAISPAELMLGFVSEDQLPDRATDNLTAYASRIRFSAARHESCAADKESATALPGLLPGGDQGFTAATHGELHDCSSGLFRLQILDSPKPPCPKMYFKNKDKPEIPVQKRELTKSNLALQPQGVKTYLHHVRANEVDGKYYLWQTQNNNEGQKQKLLVQPIRAKQTFYFHIDFDNLNGYELGLLLYALQPDAAEPDSQFHHKLGLGKPLGLGSVHIQPEGLFLVDRHDRYMKQQDLLRPGAASRYAKTILTTAADPSAWPCQYRTERSALPQSRAATERPKTLSEIFPVAQDSVAPVVHRTLVALGSWSAAEQLAQDSATARYPQGFQANEEKRYEWFSEKHQGHLRSIPTDRPTAPSAQQANLAVLRLAVLPDLPPRGKTNKSKNRNKNHKP